MTDELSVLDYVKALLTPWRGAPPPIPPSLATLEAHRSAEENLNAEIIDRAIIFETKAVENLPEVLDKEHVHTIPWRSIVALFIALAAQLSLEPGPDRTWGIGLALYTLAAAWGVWSVLRGEWRLPAFSEPDRAVEGYGFKSGYLWIGAILSVLAFVALSGNRFTLLNAFLWIAAIAFTSLAFWNPGIGLGGRISRFRERLNTGEWWIGISHWTLILLAAGLLVLLFRLFQLVQVPPEMVGDHAEKLLDIWELLRGETLIFFPRNTGREGIQMYLTAAVIKIFGTGISFTSLKIGTALAGLVTLPFIYLLGKEVGNRRVGLLAMTFAGIAYWPNVITRVALRFTLYPLFVAPTLYFLIRGLQRSNRNDFILAGLFLGLGLHGYTPFRIVPFVVLVAFGLYLLHPESRGSRKQTVFYLLLLAMIALIVFLPLLRFWVENPVNFSYRAFTRLGDVERSLPGPSWQIFSQNLTRAMVMFAWNNGEIWPVSIPNRPALDVVSGALFYLGVALLLLRYIRRRRWIDLFLILSVPLLMLPSILSLAFPAENPALNRTAGAIVPVFTIIGLSLDGFLKGVGDRLGSPLGARFAWVIGLFLIAWSGLQNYRLVFTEYQGNYSLSSWNTSEIGAVIRDFSETLGNSDQAFVVAYPHWVDTRLVGINAGFPTRDFAIWPENFPDTLEAPAPKLFIIKEDDADSISSLQLLYPEGYLQLYDSKLENKDFYQFIILPETG